MTLEFNSFDEMFAHFGESGAGSVADIVDMERIAQEESEVLKHLITVNLASYFLMYTPVEYDRTGRTLDSLKISPIIDENGYISFGVYFDPELAIHPTHLRGPDGNTAILLDTGWSLKNWPENKRIPMFTDFFANSPGDGTHYLRNAVENYNSTNPYGIVAQIFVDNELFGG